MVRPKFYGEGDILVAEGGSLIVAREVPSVGAPSSWIFDSGGTGPRSMRLGWHFFRRLDSKAKQPFSLAVVFKRGRLRPHTG